MQKNKRMEPAVGIVITMGKDMIIQNGGPLAFCKMLEHWTTQQAADSGNLWLHKSKNQPQQDIARVYVIMEGRIYCRLFYGGYQTGARRILRATGQTDAITWPRMLLSGPMEKAPHDIPMKGFQGFRYIYNDLW